MNNVDSNPFSINIYYESPITSALPGAIPALSVVQNHDEDSSSARMAALSTPELPAESVTAKDLALHHPNR